MSPRTWRIKEGWRLIAAVAAAGGIAYASLRSSPRLAEVPWLPTAWMAPLDRMPTSRHALAFFGLALILGWAWQGRRTVGASCRFFLGLAMGAGLLEILQMFQPTRSADWSDFGMAVLGALGGVLIDHGWSLSADRTPAAAATKHGL